MNRWSTAAQSYSAVSANVTAPCRRRSRVAAIPVHINENNINHHQSRTIVKVFQADYLTALLHDVSTLLISWDR